MFTPRCPLILASASPRRRDMLSQLGLTYTCIPTNIDETPIAGEDPRTFARRMAIEKAEAAAGQNKNACIIGADTVVAIKDRILGKPQDMKEAKEYLNILNGNIHTVLTAFAIIKKDADLNIAQHAETQVTFGHFPQAVLNAYADTGDPLDKAGAYGMQGLGSFLVVSIQGSASNVIGLPISLFIQTMLQHHLVRLKV